MSSSNEEILMNEMKRSKEHHIQKDLHFVKDLNDEDDLFSDFWRDTQRNAWCSQLSQPMESTNNKDVLSFQCSNNYHFLLYTTLKQRLPFLSVKKEYVNSIRICYKSDPALRAIQCLSLILINGGEEFTMDQTSLRIYLQYFCKNRLDRSLGNVPKLQNWATILPAFETQVPIPWSYSRHPRMSLPLYRSLSVVHKVKMMNDFSSLLRMQKQKINGGEEEWVDIPFDWSYMVEMRHLESARMFARYSLQAPEEIETFRCNRMIPYVLDKIITIDEPNPHFYGETVDVDLCDNVPCKALFFVIEDEDGNYVTLTGENHHESWSLLYGPVVSRVKDHTEDDDEMQAYHHFPSTPTSLGYSAYSFILDQQELPPTVGILFPSQTKLRIKLRKNETEKNKKLYVKVRLLSEQHMNFSVNPNK